MPMAFYMSGTETTATGEELDGGADLYGNHLFAGPAEPRRAGGRGREADREQRPAEPNGNGLQAALARRGYTDTPELERAVEAAARWVEKAPNAQVLLANSDPELGQPLLALAALHGEGKDA